MKSWLYLFIVVCACASTQKAPAFDPNTVAKGLVNIAQVPWDFEWRQKIEAEYPSPKTPGVRETASFEAVLQKQGNVLTMVGLTPMGTRAFVARQQGTTVSAEGHERSALPFPPAFVFLDVNRSLFVGIGTTALSDGWHTQQSHGAQIKDLWKQGLLVQRELFDAPLDTKIRIYYDPGYKGGNAPAKITLHNLRLGYRLTITTLESSPL